MGLQGKFNWLNAKTNSKCDKYMKYCNPMITRGQRKLLFVFFTVSVFFNTGKLISPFLCYIIQYKKIFYIKNPLSGNCSMDSSLA